MVVVCSGAKSILDLPSTREMLETLGVLVIGWQTSELPAFFSRESGLSVDTRVETPEEVAAIWRAHQECGITSAILTAVPAPEAHAIPAARIDELITSVLEGAARAGVRGKAVTPYLLAEIRDRTGNASLETNLALLCNNAAVAARIARALAS
jgi:pseudouridine-5'-phosphate glycosidase